MLLILYKIFLFMIYKLSFEFEILFFFSDFLIFHQIL